MTDRTLGPWNVAILLISASYGIGFVFGTGELARTIGMASSLYAAATGIGMVFLAAVAGTFWRLGAPVWGLSEKGIVRWKRAWRCCRQCGYWGFFPYNCKVQRRCWA